MLLWCFHVGSQARVLCSICIRSKRLYASSSGGGGGSSGSGSSVVLVAVVVVVVVTNKKQASKQETVRATRCSRI